MRKLRLLMILCVLVLISVGCGDDNSGGGGGGGSGTTATTTSAKTATVGCRKSSVQAGPGGSRADVLPCNVATSPQSADLTQGDEVWVSSQGEARAVVESCADIYIYHNSGLKVGGCCEDCAGAGSDACALSGTSAANNSCSNVFSVSTGSAVVYSDSTWFSVSYLDEQRVSLVAVIEGDVQVAPLGELDGTESVDRIWLPPGAFLFTMPDDQLTELSGIFRGRSSPSRRSARSCSSSASPTRSRRWSATPSTPASIPGRWLHSRVPRSSPPAGCSVIPACSTPSPSVSTRGRVPSRSVIPARHTSYPRTVRRSTWSPRSGRMATHSRHGPGSLSLGSKTSSSSCW